MFDIRTQEVDEMIRQRMEERTLYGQEFSYNSTEWNKKKIGAAILGWIAAVAS